MNMNDSSIIQDQIDGEQDDKGFTLIEILIAIVLVGILSAVAVVGISNLVSKGSTSACAASADAAKAGFGRVLRVQQRSLPGDIHRADHSGCRRRCADAAVRRDRERSRIRCPRSSRNRGRPAGTVRYELVPDDDPRIRFNRAYVRL